MPRLLSPDDACKQVDVRGHRYVGRTIDVVNPADARMLKAVGYTVADIAGSPVRAAGYICASCGFKAFFNRCGRCGGPCEKE